MSLPPTQPERPSSFTSSVPIDTVARWEAALRAGHLQEVVQAMRATLRAADHQPVDLVTTASA